MFLDLTDILRCPRPHAEGYLICGPVTMDGRDVVRGGLLCPDCGTEYPILDGVAWFAPPPPAAAEPAAPASGLTADALHAFLDVQGPGGTALLLGEPGRLGADLAARLPGVQVVAVNPPEGVGPAPSFSVLRSPAGFPVRRHSVRAVVVGAAMAVEPWLSAAAGALLPGLRLVVEGDGELPGGVDELARGAGLVVGEKRRG